MAHPNATRRPPVARIDSVEEATDISVGGAGLGAEEVESAGLAAVAADHEGPVVDPAVGAEALGQPSAPGPLLAGGLVVRHRAPRRSGRRRPGTPLQPSSRVPTRTSSSGKASRARRYLSPIMARSTVSAREVRSTVASPISSDGRAADPFEGGEGVAPELGPFAGTGDQHPLLPLFGQEPDIESRFPLSAQVGHLGQLGIADRCAVLGLHLDGHMPFRTPRSPCGVSRRLPSVMARNTPLVHPATVGESGCGGPPRQEPCIDFTGFGAPCRIRPPHPGSRSGGAIRGQTGP